MMILTLLFTLQAWSISIAESDFLDQNMAAYHQYVEGQNATYLKWMASEQSRLTQPTSLDTDSLLTKRYDQLRADYPQHSSMTRLLQPTFYTTYPTPDSFMHRPVNPYANEYLSAPELKYYYPSNIGQQ